MIPGTSGHENGGAFNADQQGGHTSPAVSIGKAVERLRRLRAGEPAAVIYGVRSMDAAVWHRERDERTLARAWLDWGQPAVEIVSRLAQADNADDVARQMVAAQRLAPTLPTDVT
jgi:hypothetical protein